LKIGDLIGQRFGKLTVVAQAEANKWGKTRWLCRCDCGKETVVIGSHLKNGMTKSCGCLRHRIAHNAADITGHKYQMLTAIKRVGSKDKKALWLFRCDCGTEKVIPVTPVIGGKTKSCGCLLKNVKRGSEHHCYRGGYYKHPDGYVLTKGENRNGKWTDRPFHVLVMEKHIGRKLKAHETVHHKNGIRDDNRIDNLELWSKKHPPGQRVEDMVAFCIEYLSEYAPKCLANVEDDKCVSVN
jgi:hypothetical protein